MHISSQFASARLLLLVDLCRLFPTHLARADTGSPLVQLHELHELFLLGRLLWIQVALTSLDSFFAHMFSFSLFSPIVALFLFCRESLSPAGSNSHTALALPLTTLDQALIVVFKEAFPLARDQEKREPASLDATGVQLDHAYLVKADLKQMWGPQASLRRANLSEANLSEVTLFGATLFGANLSEANLMAADLRSLSLTLFPGYKKGKIEYEENKRCNFEHQMAVSDIHLGKKRDRRRKRSSYQAESKTKLEEDNLNECIQSIMYSLAKASQGIFSRTSWTSKQNLGDVCVRSNQGGKHRDLTSGRSVTGRK